MAKTNIARRKRATNLPTVACSIAAAVTGEAITFSLLWRFEPDHWLGALYSALTVAFSLAGLAAARAAARRKADPRPDVAKTAFAARVMSFALVAPSIVIGGGAMAQKLEDRAAIEYGTSDAYRQTLANSKDQNLDSQVRAQATADLAKAIRPTQVRMDDIAYPGSLLAFAAIMLLPILTVGNCMIGRDETPAQEKARLRAASVAKAKATREKNARDALRAIPPAKRFNLLRNVS